MKRQSALFGVLVTATFTIWACSLQEVEPQTRLTVEVLGEGSGNVLTASSAAIRCGVDCVEIFADGENVTLTAEPNPGSVFTGWDGACDGMGICALSLTGIATVTASFELDVRSLIVAKRGDRGGFVRSNPPGIACGGACRANFASADVITLTAEPEAGAGFGGWGGACSGTGTCTVMPGTAATVFATFESPQEELTLSIQGGGRVVSTPAGLNCDADCTTRFPSGTTVSLEARPAPGMGLNAWMGACNGNGPCVVDMSQPQQVTAVFGAPTFRVTVQRVGAGVGTVVSEPAGIDCGGTCVGQFPENSQVVLRATPDNGSAFSFWSGPCTATGTTAACTIDLSGDTTILAGFE